MKRILLDTHAFLWAIEGDPRLSPSAREAFLDANNELFFSMASFWEICTKLSLKKLKLAADWDTRLRQEMQVNRIKWLPIEEAHCMRLVELPFRHRDPFDRILLAQALAEGMAILTRDPRMARYRVSVLW